MSQIELWIHLYFSWPGGWVWPNVVAMAPCAVLAWVAAKRELLKHRREILDRLEHHHREQLAAIAKQGGNP